MHILINMNYIGFYLCYLLQTAKLINVLSSVLTQLFHKVKEVQCNFLWAAGTSSVWGRWSSSWAFNSHAINWSMFKHLIWRNSVKGKILVLLKGTILILVYVGCTFFHAPTFLIVIPKVWMPTIPTPRLHFIPADCSFSNANGSSLGLGFLPCQLATGSVGRI